MGTSVSHPSPTSYAEAGKEWDDVKESIKKFTSVENFKNKLVEAYEAQYSMSAANLIVDSGVECVIGSLQAQLSLDASREDLVLNMMISARRSLAINNCNSFFSEIALSAASTALMSGSNDILKIFVVNYSKRIVDYVVSRDLPMNIGTKGLVNLNSLDYVLSQSEEYFTTKADSLSGVSTVEQIKAIFTRPGELEDE